MDFFDKFDNVLKSDFRGDFSAMMKAPYVPNRYEGLPAQVREVDRRTKKENGFIREPDIHKPEPVEPVVIDQQEELDFAVIDLDAEMDKRRKNTEADNPVQPEPKPNVTKRQATKKSSRGAAIQSGTSKTPKAKAEGNRQQRRATEAKDRKDTKTADKSPRKRNNRDGGGAQKASAPEKVNLSDLQGGFRLE